MRKIIFTILGITLMVACEPKQSAPQTPTADSSKVVADTTHVEKWGDYKKLDPKKMTDNSIQLFADQWMLITAGSKDSCNTMTAGWGTLGNLWQKPIAMCFVKQSRYTHMFMEKSEYYTLSFFAEDYRAALRLLGTKSGKDGDKIKESGLTRMATPTGSTSFSEARMIIECRKIYSEPLRKEYFADKEIFNQVYGEKPTDLHTMYIGEIVNVWVK